MPEGTDKREVIEDYRAQAATYQGLDAMDARLTAEGIAHEVEDTGGATMKVVVPLGGGEFLHVDRGDEWLSEDYGNEDEWTIFRYHDEWREEYTELGYHLTMVEALTIIRTALQGA